MKSRFARIIEREIAIFSKMSVTTWQSIASFWYILICPGAWKFIRITVKCTVKYLLGCHKNLRKDWKEYVAHGDIAPEPVQFAPDSYLRSIGR